MTLKQTLFALTALATLAGAATSAFADEYTTRMNREQYAVSAQETLKPLFAPRFAAAKLHAQGMQNATGSLIGAANPHWGPAFDPDAE